MGLLPRSRCCNEELGAVGVLSGIRHGHETLLGVLDLEVFVLEFGAVDLYRSARVFNCTNRSAHTRLSSGSIALGEVTTLDHEVLDNTVEG